LAVEEDQVAGKDALCPVAIVPGFGGGVIRSILQNWERGKAVRENVGDCDRKRRTVATDNCSCELKESNHKLQTIDVDELRM